MDSIFGSHPADVRAGVGERHLKPRLRATLGESPRAIQLNVVGSAITFRNERRQRRLSGVRAERILCGNRIENQIPGTTLSARTAGRMPDRPLSRDELKQKFSTLMADLPEATAEEIFAQFDKLESVADFTDLKFC